MKSLNKWIVLFLIIFSLAFSLISCSFFGGNPNESSGNEGDKNNTDDHNKEDTESNDKDNSGDSSGITNDGSEDSAPSTDDSEIEVEDGLVLISNGIANFQIIYTGEVGSEALKSARDVVNSLRKLGVTVSDPISDSNAKLVKSCEIIIGTAARHRGDECNIDAKHLGVDGYTVKTVGKRIVIAGGTSAKTAEALKSYVSTQMKIDDSTASLSYCKVNKDYNIEKLTDYRIDSITINGTDLSNYTLIVNIDGIGAFKKESITSFRQKLYDASGYWLDTDAASNSEKHNNKFIIQFTNDAGDDGFRAYVSGADFIVECAFANAFNNCFEKFAFSCFFDVNGDLVFDKEFNHTECASRVYYKDFGAKGDGVSDDFYAILNTHNYANQCGQKVLGDEGATYFIYPDSFTDTIPIKTDVDWNGATFIIDDVGSIAYNNRRLFIFTVLREQKTVYYNADGIKSIFGDVTLSKGDISADWLSPLIEAQSLVRVVNSDHKDFVRYGNNESSGSARTEVFLINPDGAICADTPICRDYDTITDLYIWRTDDTPLTIGNGTFRNICNRTVEETDFMIEYDAYNRGIAVERSNVTLYNLEHSMINEPDLDTSVNDMYGSGK